MATVEIEVGNIKIDAECSCGKELECCVNSGYHNRKWLDIPMLTVEPCPDCIKKAVEEAIEEREEAAGDEKDPEPEKS